MCEQCIVNPLYFGRVLPGWSLIRARREGIDMKVGEWGLLRVNNPDFVWKTTPKPDPTFGMTEEDEDRFWKENPNHSMFCPDDFDDAFRCDIRIGHELVEACIKAGYDKDEHGHYVQGWLYHHLGVWIRDHDPETEEDPFPNNDQYSPHDYSLWKD